MRGKPESSTDQIVQEHIKSVAGKPLTVRDIVKLCEAVATDSFNKGFEDGKYFHESINKQPTITIEKKHCGGKNCPGQDGCWGGDCMYPEIIIP